MPAKRTQLRGKKAFSFYPEMARQYGVDIAVWVSMLDDCLVINWTQGEDIHAGVPWMRSSARAIAEQMHYLSEDQVARMLKRARELGVVQRADFNERFGDRTSWWTFTPEFALQWSDHLESAVAFQEL